MNTGVGENHEADDAPGGDLCAAYVSVVMKNAKREGAPSLFFFFHLPFDYRNFMPGIIVYIGTS